MLSVNDDIRFTFSTPNVFSNVGGFWASGGAVISPHSYGICQKYFFLDLTEF
jgi:hypothetical protein